MMANEVQYSYAHPSVSLVVQHFDELLFPAIRLCAEATDQEEIYRDFECYLLPDQSKSNKTAINCTIFRTTHFECIEIDNIPPGVVSTKVMSQVAIFVYEASWRKENGSMLLLVLPNKTETDEFNPETAQLGTYISAQTLSQVLVYYEKMTYLNGMNETLEIHTEASSMTCGNYSQLILGISFTESTFNIQTVEQLPTMTWRQLIFTVVASLGTVYGAYSTLTSRLAKHCYGFRKRVNISDEPESVSMNY